MRQSKIMTGFVNLIGDVDNVVIIVDTQVMVHVGKGQPGVASTCTECCSARNSVYNMGVRAFEIASKLFDEFVCNNLDHVRNDRTFNLNVNVNLSNTVRELSALTRNEEQFIHRAGFVTRCEVVDVAVHTKEGVGDFFFGIVVILIVSIDSDNNHASFSLLDVESTSRRLHAQILNRDDSRRGSRDNGFKINNHIRHGNFVPTRVCPDIQSPLAKFERDHVVVIVDAVHLIVVAIVLADVLKDTFVVIEIGGNLVKDARKRIKKLSFGA
mmetsp:Transcript_12958/g.21465  ORF Transcript_12958/g.21465 Transcript_12958/m.21465 type:complete len:269 (+) Transcript_12958:1624-2430(+)